MTKEKAIKGAEKTFEQEKAKFSKAKEEYRKVLRKLKPLSVLETLPTPPTSRAAYSDRMAWIMANMAKLAYINFEDGELGHEELEYSLRSGWFNLIKTFDKNGTQAFLAKNDEFTVLAFRGTQPDKWEDVKTDLRFLKEKTVDGKVHVGFLEAFTDVKDEVFEAIRLNIGAGVPIYITGHSLGAALATVATRELDEEFGDWIAACYTFGSPRVGDGKFEKSIKTPFYRVVNTTDIVSLVPFFLGTFVHVGDPRYLSRRKVNGVNLLFRGIPNFRRVIEALIETLLALFKLNPFAPWLGAHAIDQYVEKLERYAQSRN